MKDRASQSPTTKRILKALSIFGGVQVMHILCAVIRTKLAAIWIGPAGVGLMAIYHSTTEFMSNTTQLNLRQSAVRDLSLDKDKPAQAEKTTALVRRLALFLGIAGTVIFIAASPLLGWIQFGDFDHTVPFIILSAIMLLSAVAQGELAIMQGRERLRRLAKATLYSSLTSSLLSLPLFYFFRIDSIVPVLLLFSLSSLFFALLFSDRKLRSIWQKARHGRTRNFASHLRSDIRQGRGMLSLGLYMTISSSVTLLASYIFIAYLNRTGSNNIVGFYQSGYTLINSYIGLIFTSISMEFYPRLSATVMHTHRAEVIVAHEIRVILSILAPVIVAFICAKGLIVNILYSSAFDAVIPYIAFAILGTAFRAFSWPLAFVMPAKGDGRSYVVSETVSSAFYLILNIPLYNAYGFAGLGVAYIIWYGLYSVITFSICRFRYGLHLKKGILILLATVLAIGGIAFALDRCYGPFAASVMLIPSALLAFRAIRK